VVTLLAPVEALGAFIGENPNGTWTLTIADQFNGDGGALNGWSLDIVTAECPNTAPTAPPGCTAATTLPTLTNSTAQPIPPTAPPNVITSTITVAGAQPYLWDLDVITNITHTNSADLDITITSPSGTIVTLTTDNGGTHDNVFAGTTWDDSADPDGVPTATSQPNPNQVQTHPYTNLTVATPLAPEEALAAFIGENPNGTWTLTISDDVNGNGGSLNSWSLNVTTLAAAPGTTVVPTVSNPAVISIPSTGSSVITSPVTVNTAGASIFKVKVTANITHTFTSDLQIALTSPAGTTVTFSNGFWPSGVPVDVDNVYNGTTWDDDANPSGQVPYTTNAGLASDHPYANNTVVPLLAPVEALGAFIGENPNGTWTLTIADQFDGGGGALNGWSLDIITASCVAPSPTPTPTPTPTATATATATATPTATATATATATSTPTATPTATPASQTVNLSTRLLVQTGDNIGIGGFIITGNDPKHVLVRGIGPSLASILPNVLGDPVLELHGPGNFATITNNNWKDTQQAAIEATGIAPTNDLESAIDATLAPGNYSAVLRGNNNTSGVGVVEVYDLGQGANSKLGNIATRAFVNAGNDIVIAGFILGNGAAPSRIVVRGLGPSLAAFGVPTVLEDPVLELRNANGDLLNSNNDWLDDSVQAAEITAAGLAPTNTHESAIAATLSPGDYTVLLMGLNNTTGNGLIEVYDRGGPP
jgi:subtilisin-like proprotein convertase family protein